MINKRNRNCLCPYCEYKSRGAWWKNKLKEKRIVKESKKDI